MISTDSAVSTSGCSSSWSSWARPTRWAWSSWKGGTIGKLALGLRVVNQSDRNYPPTLQAAVLRWLPGLVGNLGVIGSLASIVIAVLSIIWIFTDDYRRTVHDRIASTYVIKV